MTINNRITTTLYCPMSRDEMTRRWNGYTESERRYIEAHEMFGDDCGILPPLSLVRNEDSEAFALTRKAFDVTAMAIVLAMGLAMILASLTYDSFFVIDGLFYFLDSEGVLLGSLPAWSAAFIFVFSCIAGVAFFYLMEELQVAWMMRDAIARFFHHRKHGGINFCRVGRFFFSYGRRRQG